MADTKFYVIEGLRTLSDLTPRPGDDPGRTLSERTVEAWVVLDTITAPVGVWGALESWFNGLPDDLKVAGRYRLVDQSTKYGGGQFYEYVARPSWTVEEAPAEVEPAADLEVVS